MLRKIQSNEKYKVHTVHGTQNIEIDPDEEMIYDEGEPMATNE